MDTTPRGEQPTFLDVIMGAYDPCPCGHSFGIEDVSVIKKHYIAGHYDQDWFDHHNEIVADKKT